MSENLKLFDNYLRNKDNISSIKIPRYQENCGFEDWCLRFQAFLATQMGVRYKGLGYIITPYTGATHDPDNDVQDPQE